MSLVNAAEATKNLPNDIHLMSFSLLPWQHSLYDHCWNHGQPRHHALLLHGKPGIGKLAFAHALAEAWLCMQTQSGQACGLCQSCHWLAEGTHPDFRVLTPEDAEAEEGKKTVKKRQQILIEQIRALHDYLSLSNHQVGGLRMVLIHPLEAMNVAAANALLKLLEEPPPATQFLLISHQRQALLPTILSRCLQVAMPVPTEQQGLAWLEAQGLSHASWLWQYSGGAPLQTWADHNEIDWYGWYQQWRPQLAKGAALDLAATLPLLLKQGMAPALTILQKWLLDVWLSLHQLPLRYHAGEEATMASLSQHLQLAKLFALQQQIHRYKLTAQHPLNQELQLEQLLLQYKKLFV